MKRIPRLLIVLLLLASFGCTFRKKDKVEVFEHFFGHKPDSRLEIQRASYWATYRMGLDEEELDLEFAGPPKLIAKLAVPPDASLKAPTEPDNKGVFPFGDKEFALINMEKYSPSWFGPRKETPHVLKVDVEKKIPVFFFESADHKFAFWTIEYNSGGVFVDLTAGRVLVHLRVP